MISSHFLTWPDLRREKSIQHSIHDIVMSALACIGLHVLSGALSPLVSDRDGKKVSSKQPAYTLRRNHDSQFTCNEGGTR